MSSFPLHREDEGADGTNNNMADQPPPTAAPSPSSHVLFSSSHIPSSPSSSPSRSFGSPDLNSSSDTAPALNPLLLSPEPSIYSSPNVLLDSNDPFEVSSPVAAALGRDSLLNIAHRQQNRREREEEFSLANSSQQDSASSSRHGTDRYRQKNIKSYNIDEVDESDEDDEDEDDTGALLRQSRAKTKKEIASRYTHTREDDAAHSPAKRPRESCAFPTIFNASEDDIENSRSEDPELTEWQIRAAAAVVRHKQSNSQVYKASNGCSLSFRDEQAEKAFHYYFSSLNEHKLRRRLLLLNFLYMIYCTCEWGTRLSRHYTRVQQNWITALRVFYILVNTIIFTISFVKRNVYRKNINLFSTVLAVLTSTLIIMEGQILRNIYSPFVVLVLIMYMVGSNIYVRTLFSVSVAVCWYNVILYNFMCLVFNPRGDLSTLHSTNAALLQLFYYDLIFIFFILTIMYQTRKVEKQNRYAFLAYYVEVEAEEREREEIERRRRENGGTNDDNQSNRKKKSSNRSFASNGSSDIFDESTRTNANMGTDEERKSASHLDSSDTITAYDPPVHRPHLLPRTRSEEMALLRELNAAERAEDPFYLSRVAAMFLPVQQVTHTTTVPDDGGESGQTNDGSFTSRRSDGTLARTTTTTETVWSNDPLYTTLSIMRAKGITSMTEFVRLLAHQKKVKAASNKISELPCVCCANELPSWFTSYPYVIGSYRCNYTRHQCIRSIFEWHNETINIWTEFGPCILFIIGLIILESAEPVIFSSWIDGFDRFFVLVGLLGGVIIRPICSGLAHTFYPMSNRAFIIWWSIDYVSILLSILGYGLVMGRFTFYCMISQQIFFYISALVLFLSTIAAVLFVASPGIRTSSFILYVLFANGVPYIYQLVLTTADLEEHDVPKDYLILWSLMWCFMLFGLLVKSTMIPERWSPGRFDLIGASHQWWHILVNAGAAMTYFTWKSYLKWRPTVQCLPSEGVN